MEEMIKKALSREVLRIGRILFHPSLVPFWRSTGFLSRFSDLDSAKNGAEVTRDPADEPTRRRRKKPAKFKKVSQSSFRWRREDPQFVIQSTLSESRFVEFRYE